MSELIRVPRKMGTSSEVEKEFCGERKNLRKLK
jgi:hypothetical protein